MEVICESIQTMLGEIQTFLSNIYDVPELSWTNKSASCSENSATNHPKPFFIAQQTMITACVLCYVQTVVSSFQQFCF
jgi:hypothetical protein